ncbi:MAG: hypothetical protein ACFCUR_01195 [Rhodomicrobiaceae bacterium]
MLRIFTMIFAFTAAIGRAEATGTTQLGVSQSLSAAPADGKACETVTVFSTGFGEQKVADFAQRSLDLAVLDAKDAMRKNGAVGFSSEDRRVSCEPYIDFGPAIGREHKCQATVKLCGQTT